MEVVCLTPFRVATLLWEAKPQQFSLTVTVKATFSLVHGGDARISERQELLGVDRHWDDWPTASLFCPADNAPLKKRVDVMLVGHAYAPEARSVDSLVASLSVGEFTKSIRVTGDRRWENGPHGIVQGNVKPFLRLPLRYENAPFSADNPVGVDTNAPRVPGAPALPNLESIDAKGSVGFGPVAPTWRSRRRLVSDDGLSWAYGVAGATSHRVGPFPKDFDFSFFNAAPREQQMDLLRPGTTVELTHLSPEHAKLKTRIPPVRPQVFLVKAGQKRAEEIILRCDTLWIDCDRELLVMTFRGVADAGVGDESALGTLVAVADPAGKKIRWDRVDKKLREEGRQRVRTAPGLGGPGASDEAPPPDPLARRYDEVLAKPKDEGLDDEPTNEVVEKK